MPTGCVRALLATVLFLRPIDSPAGEPLRKKSAVDVPALIDKLVEVDESDYGYSSTVNGSGFLPLDREGRFEGGMLFQKPPVPSETIRAIVKQGAAAVPHLIAHLGDKRPTKIVIKHNFGIGGLFLGAGYDFNDRTGRRPAYDFDHRILRRRSVPKEELKTGLLKGLSLGLHQPNSHTITVGDLCYVGLGQIVNRRFHAVRYQPTAIIFVNSPTSSPALHAAIKWEWGELTPAQHRASLIEDFLKPDYEGRRIGACKRLAYYYPDALDELVLKVLAQPTYDVTEVYHFVNDKLYATPDPKECRKLFDDFIAKRGEPSRDGILRQLFSDLDWLKPPPTVRGDQPRKLLIQLYGKKKDVRIQDQPLYYDSLSSAEMARVIQEGLIYDRSRKIDKAVRDVLAAIEDDDYLALACMERLVGRGYDADIERYCQRRISKPEAWDKKLQKAIGKIGWTRLHVAVERDDLDAVKELLDQAADVNAPAKNGVAPLHLAVRRGDVELVKALLSAKPALNPKDKDGLTPVQIAAQEDHAEIVLLLARQGCDLPDVLTAATAGKAGLVEALLGKDASLVGAKSRNWRTPLHLAARRGNTRLAEVLLARRADVNAKDKSGCTPLHLAVRAAHTSLAKLLLDNGAAVDLAGDDGWPPLHLAVKEGRIDLCRLLLDHKADIRGRMPKWGIEPLHVAATFGKTEVARLLLDRKADANAKQKDGQRPLQLAACEGHLDVVKLLLDNGADVNAVDENGLSPLHEAAKSGHASVVRLLLDKRAAINGGTPKDRPQPLHLAAKNGHRMVVELLLTRGAEVNARTERGDSPLHLAVESNWPDVAALLLEHGADVSAKNDNEQTALAIARVKNRSFLVRLLRRYGAKE